jgi:hypothetical protein
VYLSRKKTHVRNVSFFFFFLVVALMEQYTQLCDYLTVVGASTIPPFVTDVVQTLTNAIGASDDQVQADCDRCL